MLDSLCGVIFSISRDLSMRRRKAGSVKIEVQHEGVSEWIVLRPGDSITVNLDTKERLRSGEVKVSTYRWRLVHMGLVEPKSSPGGHGG